MVRRPTGAHTQPSPAMVPVDDWIFYNTLALTCHAIVFWHVHPDGDYQPYLFPVPAHVWRLIVH